MQERHFLAIVHYCSTFGAPFAPQAERIRSLLGTERELDDIFLGYADSALLGSIPGRLLEVIRFCSAHYNDFPQGAAAVLSLASGLGLRPPTTVALEGKPLPVLRASSYTNETEEAIKLLVAPGDSAQVWENEDEILYDVLTSSTESALVVLEPGERISLA